MMAERTGMNYEEFEIMGRLVSEQTALMWLSNTEELMS